MVIFFNLQDIHIYQHLRIFGASLLISYCNFLSLILSLIVMINFYIVSEKIFLKRKRLSDRRVVSLNKKKMVLQYKIHKVLKVNI